jgi:hypothetical protein
MDLRSLEFIILCTLVRKFVFLAIGNRVWRKYGNKLDYSGIDCEELPLANQNVTSKKMVIYLTPPRRELLRKLAVW